MKSPKCRLCGENHWGNCEFPNKDYDDSVHKSEKVATKRVHKDDKCTQVREVGIRKLRANLSGELKDLPFRIVSRGKVIGVVSRPN